MALNFPGSPANGSSYNGFTYDGTAGVWGANPDVLSGMPAGTIVGWAAATAPSSWLIADGTAVSRTTYAALFARIGTTFGTGDGSTTFNLPNLAGRVPVGKNAGTFATLGATGGEETHVLTTPEMPSHTHGPGAGTNYMNSYTSVSNLATGGSGRAGDASASSTATAATGGGSAHNNLQPYQVINYIIKYTDAVTASNLLPLPFVRLTRNSSQSIPDSAWTSVVWTAKVTDTSGMWSSGANLTVVQGGVYHITASVAWSNSLTGSRTIDITKNGTETNADKISPFNGNHWNNLSWIDSFAPGDVINVRVLQNTGAAFTLTSADFSAIWLSN